MNKLSIGLAGVLVVIAVRSDSTPMAGRSRTRFAQSAAVGLYSPDPQHLWNRVHRQLHIRTAADGTTYGEDELDPLLWQETKYLLTRPSNTATTALLDEFLRAHAERMVTDPVKRAIFQHDLWVVFDWVASRTDADPDARRALAIPLARIIRRLALPKNQIEHLPDNYAAAVKSGVFPARYDAQSRYRAFVPPDAFDANGRWIKITGTSIDPIARAHAGQFSNSEFFVLLSVPSGAAATLEYLKSLWDFPQPFVVEPFGDGEQRVHLSSALPQVPSGTEVALVRRMLLIDDHGEIVPSSITESVQLRVFHAASTSGSLTDGRASFGDQDFFEFRLTKRGLFTGVAGGASCAGIG